MKASYPAEVDTIVGELRSSGGFSHRMAGLLDRIQSDDSFRERLRTDSSESFTIARLYGLRPSETFALVAAATILAPSDLADFEPPHFKVGPTKVDLASRYANQPLDLGQVRATTIDPVLEQLKVRPQFLRDTLGNPSMVLGSMDLNRTEFIVVYVQAAFLHMAAKGTNEVFISPEFLEAANLSEGQFRRMFGKLWRNPKT